MTKLNTSYAWTVAEAKARLSEILNLAKEEGPQIIGKRTEFVIMPKEQWLDLLDKKPSLGAWLVENMSLNIDLELPNRAEPEREIPFN